MLEIMLVGIVACFAISCFLISIEPDHDWDEDVDL